MPGFWRYQCRQAQIENGEIYGYDKIPTPSQPDAFFKWMAREMLDAAHDDGGEWAVGGYPGPVSPNGKIVGPMVNIPGLSQQAYDVAEELIRAEPASAELLESGFVVIHSNDGPLAAHAAAAKKAQDRHSKVAALIMGTGQGAGVVERDDKNPTIFREDRKSPYETGHLPIDPLNPEDTYENRISGTAIEKRTGMDPRKVYTDHPIWREVGARAGQLASYLGLMGGVELVVPTGGVGAGSSNKFKHHMEEFLDAVATYGNGPQRMFVPHVEYIDPKEAQVFELYGATGVMLDYLTQEQQAA